MKRGAQRSLTHTKTKFKLKGFAPSQVRSLLGAAAPKTPLKEKSLKSQKGCRLNYSKKNP